MLVSCVYLRYSSAEHLIPPNPSSIAGNHEGRMIGSSPHTDWGFITMITQDGAQVGLEYCDKDTKEWKAVPPIPGTIIVNVGDYVSLISKGQFISPLHRVVNAEGTSRTSFVFFFYPDYNSRYGSIFIIKLLSLYYNKILLCVSMAPINFFNILFVSEPRSISKASIEEATRCSPHKVSLLTDQRVTNMKHDTAVIEDQVKKNQSFGDFISMKGASVHRGPN